ncbi:unnamed protein product, partial [Brenthis ino]
MPFKRVWDSSCPRIWDSWEDSEGLKWVIQDLAPEDDDTALQILIENLAPDETLCMEKKLCEDQASLTSMSKFWQACLSQRMSLGCYVEVNGKKSLVALNVCIADTVGEKIPYIEIEGEAWKQVYGGLLYAESKLDAFKYLEVDTILHAFGLVVKREYRGHKLGWRILRAREPLCTAYGIKATATVFTGPASQISAERAGFKTIAEASLKELAENGLDYPKDETRIIKFMVKKFL